MLNIIGGTYYEFCRDPEWDELFGSGFRSVLSLVNNKLETTFHTYADEKTTELLGSIESQLNTILDIVPISRSIEFHYDHPLANPTYYPDQDYFQKVQRMSIKGKQNVVCFGMLEGNAIVECNKAVYDPQSPANPRPFFENGSRAQNLIIVLNYREAQEMTKANDIETIGKLLIQNENCEGAIVKNGAEGAFVIEAGKDISHIPAFITQRVWPIGSGDIFTSQFGYYWMMKEEPIKEAAYKASLATAYYVNSKTLPISIDNSYNFIPFVKRGKRKKVYLAGPFFTMGQRWLVSELKNSLEKSGVDVFSPFHDVGLGAAKDVVHLDIQAIHDCDIIVAIADGLDAGTIFEVGYAKAHGKSVIVFVENERRESLTMLEGTNCIFENDFSTVVYKTIWEVYK